MPNLAFAICELLERLLLVKADIFLAAEESFPQRRLLTALKLPLSKNDSSDPLVNQKQSEKSEITVGSGSANERFRYSPDVRLKTQRSCCRSALPCRLTDTSPREQGPGALYHALFVLGHPVYRHD